MFFRRGNFRSFAGKAVITVRKMKKAEYKDLTLILIFIMVLSFLNFCMPMEIGAENEGQQYQAWIDDAAGLFTDAEEEELLSEMEPLSGYEDFIVHTTNENSFGDTEEYAKDYFDANLGSGDNGTVFVIDMDQRVLYMWSEGAAYNVITPYQADLITDNIYMDAHKGNYVSSVSEGISECLKLWRGGRINAPMRLISTVMISISLALLINLIVMLVLSSSKQASPEELASNAKVSHHFKDVRKVLTRTTKVYNPPDSGGGSGGGGGGSSGGGGGHGF